MTDNPIRNYPSIISHAVLYLFFIQSAGMLVEAIYILDLMNTRLDEKAAGILFFFSPIFLLIFRQRDRRRLIWGSAAILLFSRGIAPYLNTDGRLLAAGIATGAALWLIALRLGEQRLEDDAKLHHTPAQGFALALGISVLLRTLNYSLDVSLEPGRAWLGWALGLAWIGVMYNERTGKTPTAKPDAQIPATPPTTQSFNQPKHASGAVRSILGMFCILALGFLAFFSPGVIARWTEGSYTLIVSAISLLSGLWLWLSLFQPGFLDRLTPSLLLVWNVLFSAALTGLILSHSVPFPATPEAPAVIVGAPSWLQQGLLFTMLLLSPVIYVDFDVFASVYLRTQTSPRRTAGGFLLGAMFLVLLIFMHIFSNVWGYVEPVSPFFRGKFWLPYLLPALLAAFLALWASRRKTGYLSAESSANDSRATTAVFPRLMAGLFLGTIFVAILTTAWLSERPNPQAAGEESALQVMTYNIQQTNDDNGQKAHMRQLELIRQVNPDVLALQESDAARVSLGNNDYVRYYAGKLGYYTYYGPKTVTGTYGTALLSRFPLENTRTVFTYSDQDEIGTTEAEIVVGERRFTIYNVHPDGSDTAMLSFAQSLLERSASKEYVIALGDYNLRANEQAYQMIDSALVNAWTEVYPGGGSMPEQERIDHIFVSEGLQVRNPVYLPPPDSATDHPAHWAEIGW